VIDAPYAMHATTAITVVDNRTDAADCIERGGRDDPAGQARRVAKPTEIPAPTNSPTLWIALRNPTPESPSRAGRSRAARATP
jgi:hypothetical protein